MFGPDHDPFRGGVGVVAVHVGLEGQQLGGEELDAEAVFLRPLQPALPTVE
jgi:hypothetical protein